MYLCAGDLYAISAQGFMSLNLVANIKKMYCFDLNYKVEKLALSLH